MTTSPPAPRPAGRVRRALVVLVAVGTSLVAAEIAVRVFKPQANTFTGHKMFVADPDIGYVMEPGHRFDSVQINSHGLRDVERDIAKPAGVRRVLMLGDSFAFGSQIGMEDAFPHRLEVELGPGVQVINSGTPGYSTVQERAWLQKYGLAWQADAVVVAFYVGNDPWENLGLRRTVVYEGELWLQDNLPSWWESQATRSHLFRLLRSAFTGTDIQGGVDDPRARYFDMERRRMPLYALPGQGGGDDYEPGWRTARDELARIRDLVAPRPVVVLVIPDELQVDAALRQAVLAAAPPLDPSHYDFDMPQRRTAQICTELGLPLVDPMAELRRRTAAGERLYLEFDTHWNEAGNRLGGEMLAQVPALRALRP